MHQPIWQPLNLTAACPPDAQLGACSNFGYLFLNLLVNLYGSAKETQGRTNEEKGEGGEYDFIIVGAGAAGCVIANRLTEIEDWKVLLLEAGPEQPDVTLVPAFSTALIGSNVDWQYSTEPNGKSCLASPGGKCIWPRGKTLGGSSSINSMAYVRGNRLDYDNWAAMGNEGWSYNDVLPFFIKTELNINVERLDRKYHGVFGLQTVQRFPYIDMASVAMTQAFNEGGLPILDFNGAHQTGTLQAQTTSYDGERQSTNTAYIKPIRDIRKNLVIKTNSEAFQIIIDEQKRACGIKYARNGKVHTAKARKEVIISGGVINSPKLLLLSGIGPRDELEKLNIPVIQDLHVGDNLQDHVSFSGIAIALSNETVTTVSQQEIIRLTREFKNLKLKGGPLSGNGPVSTVAFLKSEPNLPAPDVQFEVDNINWQEFTREPVLSYSLAIFPTAFYDGAIPRPMNLVPKSRGKLVLDPKDPLGKPLIQPNYFGDPTDLIPLIRGTRFLISLENTPAFKDNGFKFVKTPLPACKHLPWGTDEYTVCLATQYTSTPYHPVGTCKMGPKWDKTAVVDPKLRVYGISRLRVIDSSIMPVVPRGNLNGPSIMIGERGVQFVLDEWLNEKELYINSL